MASLVARAQQASQATLGRKVNKDQPPSLQDQGVRRDALDCQESLAWKESRARQDPKVIGKLFFPRGRQIWLRAWTETFLSHETTCKYKYKIFLYSPALTSCRSSLVLGFRNVRQLPRPERGCYVHFLFNSKRFTVYFAHFQAITYHYSIHQYQARELRWHL